MRFLVPLTMLAAVVVLTACGAHAAAPGRPCTGIGTPVGIGVRIDPDVAARFGPSESLQVCWYGSCRSFRVALRPASAVVESACTGSAPSDACSARMRETGGKTGFADIPDLPDGPVSVTFAGTTLNLTPTLRYPNGPACGSGGPQAALTVDGAGIRAVS